MRSLWSSPLFSAFRVRVRADLFLLALVLGELIWGLRQGLGAPVAGVLGILLASILLHEFGHVLAARRMGGSADEIVLGPLGGLTTLDAPRTPEAQFWTAAGGPAMSLLLALSAWAWMGLEDLPSSFSPAWTQSWAATVFQVNLVLLLFNLIPAFPMDGGRMLQAACWSSMGYARSSRLALGLGFAAAFLMGVAGLAWQQWMLLAIAFMNLVACQQERLRLASGEGLEEDYGIPPPEEAREGPGWMERMRQARREKERLRKEAREIRLRSRVDSILEKINRVGMQGLTEEERSTLKEASDVFKHSRR